MECNEVRKILSQLEFPVQYTEKWQKAMEHKRNCVDCQLYFQSEENFVSAVRNRVEKSTPKNIKKKFIKTLRNKSSKQKQSRTPYYAALAVVILILTIIPIYLSFNSKTELLIGQLVDDHMKFSDFKGVQLKTSSKSQIREWFKMNHKVNVSIPQSDARLFGSRLCYFHQTPQAFLYYKYKEHQISLIIIKNLKIQSLDWQDMDNGKKYVFIDGFTVLTWKQDNSQYFMVSSLGIQELNESFI